MLFILTHRYIFHLIAKAHLICVFPSFANDTHNRSWFKCSTYLLTIISEVCNMKSFHLTNKMCNVVSTRIKLIHITSFKLSNIRQRFSYSMCINGFCAICGIFCRKGASKGSQHQNYFFYVCKSTICHGC